VSLDISNAPKKNTAALLDYWRKMTKHLVIVRYDTISKIFYPPIRDESSPKVGKKILNPERNIV
jgi:hypothetical protein